MQAGLTKGEPFIHTDSESKPRPKAKSKMPTNRNPKITGNHKEHKGRPDTLSD